MRLQFFRRYRRPFLVFFFCFLIYFLGVGGHLYSIDEVTNYLLAESLFLHRRIDIVPDLAYATTFNFNITELPGMLHDGRFYSWYGLLEPLSAIPLYAVARAVGFEPWVLIEIFFYPIVTALTCVLVYSSGKKLSYSEGVSTLLAFIYGFASFAWPYSKFFNDGPLATLMILMSASFIFGEEKRASQALMCGIFGGLAILARPAMALVIPAFLVYLWLEGCRPKHAGAYLLPIFFAGIIFGYYNYTRFGSVFQFGLGREQTLAAYSLPLVGVWGLLASPGVGLIFYFPLAILLPVYYPSFYIKHRNEAILFGLVFAAALCFYGSYRNWHGWGYWGPRYLLVSLPFLVLSLGQGLTKYHVNLLHRVIAATLMLLGFFINLLGVLVYFQVGFSIVWSRFGSQWVDIALWNPVYSPIYIHLKLLLGILKPVQLDFGFGEISPGKLDLLWAARFGALSLAILFLEALIMFACLLWGFDASTKREHESQ